MRPTGASRRPAQLVLADGATFRGEAFGADGEAVGEVVFNTSMSGYQEILTDPSYRGQLVTMTYPEIGNVGVNAEDAESRAPFAEGFIVREYWERPSSWRAEGSLGAYLRQRGVVGITGIDTRGLVRHLRDKGVQQGVISTSEDPPERLAERARCAPGLVGRDLVKEVSCEEPYDWAAGPWALGRGYETPPGTNAQGTRCVVAYDYGIKHNILRSLVAAGCRVRVVPAWTAAADVLAMKPRGVFLSNGPGDPDAVPYARDIVRALLGKVPIFGICLGHQILALALGARTYKLKFGHHGANHPVKDLRTGQVEITAQNHGFAVDADSLPPGVAVTHLNLNDHTVEGLVHERVPAFSVQYHPESSPGPRDARYLFGRFVELMDGASS
jgi:carbamoyl-phosphate synthase small subunit